MSEYLGDGVLADKDYDNLILWSENIDGDITDSVTLSPYSIQALSDFIKRMHASRKCSICGTLCTDAEIFRYGICRRSACAEKRIEELKIQTWNMIVMLSQHGNLKSPKPFELGKWDC